MKSTNLKLLATVLSCAIIGSSLIACSTDVKQDGNSSKPNSSQTQTQTQKPQQNTANKNDSANSEASKDTDKSESPSQSSGNNISVDVYNEKINYYMDLVESLQQEIVDLKQEHYIEEGEYKAKIRDLEQNVSELLDRIESIASGSVITPVDPSDKLSSDNPDNISKKSDFQYEIQDGKAVITKYVGKDTNVVIPDTIDNYKVCAIGESAFADCDLQSVTIPNSVRHIDWFAFAGCTSLLDITVPSSVMKVEYGAFDYCPRAMKVHCEKGSYIEAYAHSWGMTVIAE